MHGVNGGIRLRPGIPWIPGSIALPMLRFLLVPTFEQLWYFPNA